MSVAKRAPGQRGPDRQFRRLRLDPALSAELERRLVVIVDELSRKVGELETKPLREVVDSLEEGIAELSDHYGRCRAMLDDYPSTLPD